MSGTPLVHTLKTIIERSYAMRPVIEDLAPFIIGDRGLAALYGQSPARRPTGPAGARLLVRETGSSLRASLYYPDALVRHLELFHPLAGLGDRNIDAFAVLVEELDHLLVLASRAAEGRPVSLLELEHHANVTKYLVVVHLLGKQTGRRRISEQHRLWARHHLFEKYPEGEGEQATRYRRAAGLAERYVRYLDSKSAEGRRTELRLFQRRPFSDTLRLLTCRN
ncbi:MAG: hypothetical protein ACE5JH_03710 [Acidobacteriota bacterium]